LPLHQHRHLGTHARRANDQGEVPTTRLPAIRVWDDLLNRAGRRSAHRLSVLRQLAARDRLSHRFPAGPAGSARVSTRSIPRTTCCTLRCPHPGATSSCTK
jgi:hypothetical protein